MKKVTRKFISLMLVLTLTMSLFSQGVLAKNNKSNPSSNTATNSQELLFKTEEGLYGSEMIALPYDEEALLLLNELITTTTSSALTISISDETITENEESSDDLSELAGSNFEDLILQYQEIIENDFIYGTITTNSSLFDIKHKIIIQIHELQKNTDLTDENLAMIDSILFNFRKSNEIITQNSLQLLSYLVSNVENKGTAKNVEAKLKVAFNHFDKTCDFQAKGLFIPEFKSYENSYDAVIKGLDKQGIDLCDAYFDTEIDTDGDTLLDGYELLLGLNPYNADTDNDGLDDNIELMTNPYCDPLLVDTDSDGITDLDEDIDQDRLSNSIELEYNTFIMADDSDEDGLQDGFEVNHFNTSPTLYDTDSDGLSDGDEHALGTDPNNSDSDNDGIIDSEEIYQQIVTEQINEEEKTEVSFVSVQFGASDNISRTTTIDSVYGTDMRVSEIVGLVGAPVSIETTSQFDHATITFGYDENELGEVDEENLGILWFDEENSEFVLLDASLDTSNNTISTNTNHFSIYMVVDKEEWFDLWSTQLDYSRGSTGGGPYIPDQYFDIVFAIDSSGSMSSNDPSGMRKEAAKQFVDAFYSGDQGAVVDFDSYAYIRVHLTQDQDAIKSAIDTINSSGGTNIDRAINTSIDELLSAYANENNEKIIILLTDGSGTYYNSTTQRAIENNITIYTIGLGYGVNNTLLENIAADTGGKYYQAAGSDELRDIFFGIEGDTIGDGEIDTTDTDGDGLYDVYEIVGMKTSYGIIYTDPLKSDTDGDGLSDSEELGTISFDHINLELEYKLISNPLKKDSDGDGIRDDIDPRKMIYNINDTSLQLFRRLETLAIDYDDGENSKKYSTSKSDWLVFMFIRHFNPSYVSDTWSTVGGSIDQGFIDYVKENDIELYNSFESLKYINGDEGSNEVDLYHMAATLCVYIYKSDNDDGFEAGVMPEKHIDNLGGWAGDLQTLTNDIKENECDENDYEKFYDKIYDYIGDDLYSFSHPDLLADIDALNTYELIDSKSIYSALISYYSSDYEKRYTLFVDDQSKKEFAANVYTYTKNSYYVIQWPLFNDKVKGKQSKAAKDAFTEYIWLYKDNE